MQNCRKRIFFITIILIAVLLLFPGCRTPTATLDLIAIGRKGLASAREAQKAHQIEMQRYHKSQIAALDSAFDNDVRLIEAGQIKTADGNVKTLDADWVISARKGYAAARTVLAEQAQANMSAGLVEMDNINAADEALEMATQLTVLQWNVGEQIKRQFLKLSGLFSKVEDTRNVETSERN